MAQSGLENPKINKALFGGFSHKGIIMKEITDAQVEEQYNAACIVMKNCFPHFAEHLRRELRRAVMNGTPEEFDEARIKYNYLSKLEVLIDNAGE